VGKYYKNSLIILVMFGCLLVGAVSTEWCFMEFRTGELHQNF
jgi:hypothetical protein